MRNIIIVALTLAALLVGCQPDQRPRSAYQEGDVVCIKLTGEKGMITWIYASDQYEVRLSEARISSKDLVPRNYPTITFKEYELERCQ